MFVGRNYYLAISICALVLCEAAWAGGLERQDRGPVEDQVRTENTQNNTQYDNAQYGDTSSATTKQAETQSETRSDQALMPAKTRAGALAQDFVHHLQWGLGVAGASYPHYPGADQTDQLVLPVPYLEYYGEQFQIDDDGLAAHIFDSDRVRLDLSVNGALPVDSEDNRARTGMPDLELMAELGPSLEFTLIKGENWQARLDVPVRLNIDLSGDFMRDRGMTADPRLHLERKWGGLSAEVELGALYGDRRYHDVFYAVSAADAVVGRPAFAPSGGLLAYRASTTLKYRRGSFLLIGYARYMDFSDHTNLDSPLMKKKDYLAGGLALIRMFKGW